MSTEKAPTSSPTRSFTSTLYTFAILYLTTLFSLDTWAAARGSPHRAPDSSGNNYYLRPAPQAPGPDSYQGRMSSFRGSGGGGSGGNGGNGGGGGGGRRDIGRPDNRAPLKMKMGAGCASCSS